MNIRILNTITIILLLGCNNQKKEFRKTVESWKGKKIEIPILQMKVNGRDILYNQIWNKEYKILHYIDSSGCTSCKLHLYDWTLLIQEIEKFMPQVACVFVLTLKDYSDFEQLQFENNFKWPVFYDPYGKFNSLNHLPTNVLLQTFLLDRDNKILAIGNPAKNKSIWELYKKIIKGEIIF